MFFDFSRLKKSFLYAGRGLGTVWQKEQNFRFHVLAAFLVLILAWFLEVSRGDFIILLFLIGLVMILELVNTVFERVIDLLRPRVHEYSKEIKNISSAIVLIASLLSVVIGFLIFYPYVLGGK